MEPLESLEHLTPIDREILNKSWSVVSKDMQQVAVNIFQMIFEQAPDAKLMFSFMVKDYKEDKKSNEFIFHAVRFLQVIESTMTHLDDPSQLDAVFLNLGKIHAKHEEQLGFSAHYWSVFKECVLFHFRRAMKSNNKFAKRTVMSFAEIDSAIILWREVLRFIIDRMKVGYCQNGEIRKANKKAINGQHSTMSPDDSGLSSGHSVETKQDLTQRMSTGASSRSTSSCDGEPALPKEAVGGEEEEEEVGEEIRCDEGRGGEEDGDTGIVVGEEGEGGAEEEEVEHVVSQTDPTSAVESESVPDLDSRQEEPEQLEDQTRDPEESIAEPEPEPEPEETPEVLEVPEESEEEVAHVEQEEQEKEPIEPISRLEPEEPLVEEAAPPTLSPESPVPDTPTMEEESASRELDGLQLLDQSPSPQIQNNENEAVRGAAEKKANGPSTTTPAPRSGIRPPTAVLRQPKPVSVPLPSPRPATTPTGPQRSAPAPRTAPSPRPSSKMSRERSDVVQKSTSTKSIDNVGKFTPKVNAKFVNVKSKVGSITNHKPGGGNVEIFSEKKEYAAQSKVGSLKNSRHVAGGGNVQIESRRLDFSHASPKVGSKTNYQPAKSDVKIVTEKLTWNAKSKVGSMENAAHKPTGGNVQVRFFATYLKN